MKAEVGNMYVHYKNGNIYTVVALGRLENNPEEEYVVYRAEYGSSDYGNNATWIRPRNSFEDEVNYNGVLMHRFTVLQNDLRESIESVEEENIHEDDDVFEEERDI